jgi:6-phosphofructokinase 1
MAELKRIGVLTSGGDAPGMNAAIRAVVRQGIDLGLGVVGIRRGFAGLIEDELVPLGVSDVSGIMDRGGTILQSFRSAEFLGEEGQRKALETVAQEGLEGLVVIGGDGSLHGAELLHREGVPTVGIPATIDNDVYGTDIAIGVDTALNTVVEALSKIRDTATSHQRAFVVETMGRESGYIALMAGLAGGAEYILIPEVEVDLDEMAEVILRGYERGKRHAIIVVAEGVFKDAARTVGNYIERKIGYEVRMTVLGHLQRGGSPTAFDRILASRLGAQAVEELAAGRSGEMVALVGNRVEVLQLEEVLGQRKEIDRELFALAQVLSK